MSLTNNPVKISEKNIRTREQNISNTYKKILYNFLRNFKTLETQ